MRDDLGRDGDAAELLAECPVCGRTGLAVLRFRDSTPVLRNYTCPLGCVVTATEFAGSELADLLPDLDTAFAC